MGEYHLQTSRFSLSDAMNFAVHLYLCLGDADAREQGLTPMLATGEVLHGWSKTLLGAMTQPSAGCRMAWHAGNRAVPA